MNALIVYHTMTGHTQRAADDIAEGLQSEGVVPRLVAAGDMQEWDVADVAIVAVGSPCHAGSLAIGGGLSGPVRAILRQLGSSTLEDKQVGAFAVNCSYGGRRTVRAIEKSLRGAGGIIVRDGIVVRAGVPFSVITGPMASENARAALREFGKALALAVSG